MAHGLSLWNVVPLLPVVLMSVQYLVARHSDWKTGRLERRAAEWPAVQGGVRGGSVALVPYAGFRLTLTYEAFASGHGIDLWRKTFRSRQEADHARDVLAGKSCSVHVNPEHDRQMTLLWSEVRGLLAQSPFVAVPVRLSRTAYRWLTGLAALAWVGLALSAGSLALVSAGSPWCVCGALVGLFLAGAVILFPSAGILARLSAEPGQAGAAGMTKLFARRQMAVMVCSVLIAGVSLAHYLPMLRALPPDAQIPDRVLAGSLGVLSVPVYWFALMVAMRALERWKPAAMDRNIPAAM